MSAMRLTAVLRSERSRKAAVHGIASGVAVGVGSHWLRDVSVV